MTGSITSRGAWPTGTTVLAPESTFKTVCDDGERLLAFTENGEVLEVPKSGAAPRSLATLDRADDVRLARAGGEVIALVGRRRESTTECRRLGSAGVGAPFATFPQVVSFMHWLGTPRGLFVATSSVAFFSAPGFDERVDFEAEAPTSIVASDRGVVWLGQRWLGRPQKALFELRTAGVEAQQLIELPLDTLDSSFRLAGRKAFFLKLEESWVSGSLAGEAREAVVGLDLHTGVMRTLMTGVPNARGLHVTASALYIECEPSVREPRSYELMTCSPTGAAARDILKLPFWFGVVGFSATHLFVVSRLRGIAKVPLSVATG